MKRCCLYARVSTTDQHVSNQLLDLRIFAERRSFTVTTEYTDVGVSGSKARRPGLDSLLRDAHKKKFDVVLISSFDRLGRSTKNFLSLVDEFESLGIEFISIRENIDTHGPMGRLFLTVISSVAELELSLMKERICAGMRRRKLEGLSIGRRPLDVDHAAIVAERLAGDSLTTVAKRHNVSRASVVRWVREAQPQPVAMAVSSAITENTEERAA